MVHLRIVAEIKGRTGKEEVLQVLHGVYVLSMPLVLLEKLVELLS